MRIGAIIRARRTSTRLPGKVLVPVARRASREVFDLIEHPWFKFEVRADGNQTGEDIYILRKVRRGRHSPACDSTSALRAPPRR